MKRRILAATLFSLLLAACVQEGEQPGDSLGEEVLDTPVPVVETEPPPSAVPSTEAAPTEAAPELTFAATTFRDEEAGFAFEHPETWTLGGIDEQHSRGRIRQLVEGDEVRLDLVLQLWDPVGDLDAFVAQRKLGWESSESEILVEERSDSEAPLEGATFVVLGPDGQEAFFHFAVLDDRYLVLSGSGDMALLTEIAGTLRRIEPSAEADADAGDGDDPEAAGGLAGLDCQTEDTDSLDWVACNVIAALETGNTQPLLGYMSDPFGMLYWQSEGISVPREQALAEIESARLPADPSPSFTADRSAFPDMMGVDPAGLLGPEVELELLLFSQGWGADGEGEAILYFVPDETGAHRWQALLLAGAGFDR